MKSTTMAAAVLAVLATGALAEPVRSSRVWEVKPSMEQELAKVMRPAKATRPAVKACAERTDCNAFAGAQMLRFLAGTMEAAKDSKGRVSMVAGDSLRIVAY